MGHPPPSIRSAGTRTPCQKYQAHPVRVGDRGGGSSACGRRLTLAIVDERLVAHLAGRAATSTKSRCGDHQPVCVAAS